MKIINKEATKERVRVKYHSLSPQETIKKREYTRNWHNNWHQKIKRL